MELKIIYTSDTHGRITAYDFLNKNYGNYGLSRLSSYLKSIDSPYLLLDNGDALQGSPLLDYTRKNKLNNPVSKIFNALNYNYITLGNHDFNYGFSYLESFVSSFNNDVLCANIYKNNSSYFKPYAIHEIDGIKIAIIGLTTEFVPIWEKPEHIKNLKFMDVITTTNTLIHDHNIKNKADLIVVLYHGGYNKNLHTNEAYGPATNENKGYELFQNTDIDILLTGHQHVPQIFSRNNRVTLQTSVNASDIGVVTIDYDKPNHKVQVKSVNASIVLLSNYPIDQDIESLISNDVEQTNLYLSQSIGTTAHDMSIKSPLSCRIKKHPIFQLINQVQMKYTNADISLSSLPNETHGFLKKITLTDIAVNFPFENDLVVLEINGEMLKQALEVNANYFSIKDDEIIINPKYTFPKLEHYNYDVYDGINYTLDISKPVGQRVTQLSFNDKPVNPNQLFKLALNSYRALGSGGFDMFKNAKKIVSYPVSYFELIKTFVEEHSNLNIELIDNFKVIK